MKRLNTHISSRDASLEKAPEILKAICVNASVNVLDRVIDYLMRVITLKAVVRKKRISVERRARFDVILNRCLKSCSSAIWYNHRSHFATTLKNAHDSRFIFPACASNAALLCCDVHIASFAADESFVGFNLATHLLSEGTSLHRK